MASPGAKVRFFALGSYVYVLAQCEGGGLSRRIQIVQSTKKKLHFFPAIKADFFSGLLPLRSQLCKLGNLCSPSGRCAMPVNVQGHFWLILGTSALMIEGKLQNLPKISLHGNCHSPAPIWVTKQCCQAENQTKKSQNQTFIRPYFYQKLDQKRTQTCYFEVQIRLFLKT